MSFPQQLARKTVTLQQAYDAETQRLLQVWVTEIKEKFIQKCQAAADQRQFSCRMDVNRPDHLSSRDVREDLLQQHLQGILAELGFRHGAVSPFFWKQVPRRRGYAWVRCTRLTANWDADAPSAAPKLSDSEFFLAHFRATLEGYRLEEESRFRKVMSVAHRWRNGVKVDDATSTSPPPSSTSATCPICWQHGPAVVLMPCGHVLCRYCHFTKDLQRCHVCHARINGFRGQGRRR